MQATSVLSIPVGSCTETSANKATSSVSSPEVSSGSGTTMRINGKQEAKSSRSQFNKILHQGMTSEECTLSEDTDLNSKDDSTDKDGTTVMDVSALLMQLNVLGAAAVLAAGTAETPADSVEVSGVVMLDPAQMAGEAETTAGLTAAVNGTAGDGVSATQTADSTTNVKASFDVSQLITEINNAINEAGQATDGSASVQVVDAQAAPLKDVTGNTIDKPITEPDNGAQAVGAAMAGTESVTTVVRTVENTKAGASSDDAGAGDGTNSGTTGIGVGTSDDGKVTGNTPTMQQSGAFSSKEGDADSQSSLEAGAAAFDKLPEDSGAVSGFAAATFSQSGGIGVADSDKASAVDKAFMQLTNWADDLRGLKAGTREISIVLEPKSLGVLTISVSHSEHGISAKIWSENKDICSMMNDRLQQLVSTMETRGISVRDVNVVYGANDRGFDFSQQSSAQQGNQQSGGSSAQREQKRDQATETTFWETSGTNDDNADTTVVYRV